MVTTNGIFTASAYKRKEADPFVAAKFWIELGGVREGVFAECSGLSVETEVTDHAEGGVNGYVHKLPGRTKYSNITLKRGFTVSDELWQWYSEIVAGTIKPRKVSIVLYENKGNNEGQEVARWSLENAFPVKWQGPDLRTEGNAVAVETLEITHTGWQATVWRKG